MTNHIAPQFDNHRQIASKQTDLETLRIRAQQGDVSAQTELGRRYYYSAPGIEQNYHEALRWFMKATDQGSATAQNYLGEMYYYGHGVVRDYQQARRWFTEASEQGNADGQVNLANLYLYGYGVEKNPHQALHLCQELAEQGHAHSQMLLGLIQFGTGTTIDDQKVLFWIKKAADQGDSQAEFHTGMNYYCGVGVNKDREMAVFWFNKAAEHADIAYLYATLQSHLKNQRLNEADAVTQNIIRHITGRQRIDSREAAEAIPPFILTALDHWWWSFTPHHLAERKWVSRSGDFTDYRGFFSGTWFEWILEQWHLV